MVEIGDPLHVKHACKSEIDASGLRTAVTLPQNKTREGETTFTEPHCNWHVVQVLRKQSQTQMRTDGKCDISKSFEWNVWYCWFYGDVQMVSCELDIGWTQ